MKKFGLIIAILPFICSFILSPTDVHVRACVSAEDVRCTEQLGGCVCVRMWSTFHKIKDDIDSVTSRERAVGNDSCPL